MRSNIYGQSYRVPIDWYVFNNSILNPGALLNYKNTVLHPGSKARSFRLTLKI